MSHSQGRLPDFIIIGAAKSGTTSLWHYLDDHQGIFMSTPKEPCFFDEEVSWSKGIDWYKSLFTDCKDGQICGEASTNYTRWPQVKGVPEKLYALIPNVKLIYVMRNPVDRAFSHYVHRWTKETHPGEPFTQNFDEYQNNDPMCIDSSMYYKQIEQYLDFFPKKQILPIVFEELIENPEKVIFQVYDFLEIEDNRTVKQLPKSNENKKFRFHVVKNDLRARLKKNNVTRYLLKLIPSFVKEFIYKNILIKTTKMKSVSEDFEPNQLTTIEKQNLKVLFEKPNQQLAEKTGVDVSFW